MFFQRRNPPGGHPSTRLFGRRSPSSRRAGGFSGALRLLLVDDMEQSVTLLQEGLEGYGHKATVALSGLEAISRFSAERFDVMICDLGMPGMNGWQVGRAITSLCARDCRPKPPFILLTGWGGQVAEATQMAESGVDRVVEKPVDFPRLMDVIRELVP